MAQLTKYIQTRNGMPAHRILCPDCASGLADLAPIGRIYAIAACDLCAEPAYTQCRACYGWDLPASVMQPAFCIDCIQAMLRGRANRHDTA